jgi:hypothetical protein
MDELKPGNKTKRKGIEEEKKIGRRELPGRSPSSRPNTPAPQPSPGTASSHLLPRDDKLLDGALGIDRSAAASPTLEMKAAALCRL